MPNQDISLSTYDPQTAALQRQQQLAALLQQQALTAPETSSYNGIPAPISPFQGLAKLLQAYSARKIQEQTDTKYTDLQTSRRADLAKMLSTQFQTPAQGVQQTDIAPQQGGIVDPMSKASAPMTVPGIAADPSKAGISDARAKTPQEQMASALAMMGSGNPMAAQIAPQLYGMAANRDEKTWENAQPMAMARQQEIDAQSKQAQDNAKFQNALGPTPEQVIQNNQKAAELAEERRKNALMYGSSDLSADSPVGNAWVKAVTDGSVPGINNVPKQYRDYVATKLANAPQQVFVPQAGRRFGMTSNQIVGPLMKLPQYELTAQGLPLIQRMQAALKTPGSVSDQELLDSFTKLSTSGNAVTDAQVRIITDGKTVKDWAGIQLQKLTDNGGVLSPKQRQDIMTIAGKTYDKYREGYEPLYKEATDKLMAAGIPKPFWTIPDLNKLNAAQTGGGRSAPADDDANAQAMAWANANPNDPRAAQIKQHLGVK